MYFSTLQPCNLVEYKIYRNIMLQKHFTSILSLKVSFEPQVFFTGVLGGSRPETTALKTANFKLSIFHATVRLLMICGLHLTHTELSLQYTPQHSPARPNNWLILISCWNLICLSFSQNKDLIHAGTPVLLILLTRKKALFYSLYPSTEFYKY